MIPSYSRRKVTTGSSSAAASSSVGPPPGHTATSSSSSTSSSNVKPPVARPGPSSTVTSASAPSSSSSAAVAATASTSSSTAAGATPLISQEYSVRVPKTNLKPISIMRFNGALGVDPSKWTSLKMAREDNSRLHKPTIVHEEDNMPKFGAGSEYGREAREEARRKKYGGRSLKKYNIEDQPWVMKAADSRNRKYRGVKEGGVSENASYYIFTQAVDGGFEVFPVNHWFNFTPIQRYKSLTAEEAEEQFGRRNKIYNYFSVMVRKRLKADDDRDEEAEELPKGKAGKKASSGLKVSEMEDWDDSDNEESEDGDSDKEDGDKKPKKKGGKAKPKKKKKASDDEAEEDSDDGDEEGRELDYISDTSETESEEEKEKKNDVIGVDQEDGLKNLLDSDSDEEEAQAKDDVSDDEEEEEGGDANAKKAEDAKDGKKKTKKKAKATKSDTSPQENLSDDDDDDDKIVDELDNALESAKLEAGGSGGNSRDGTPDTEATSGTKRKASSDILSSLTNASKKAKMEVSPSLVQSAAAEGITEEAVRRYLLRKPMTVTELLQKFKSKKTKIQSHDMVNVIAHILKKINPVKRMQNQKMYLYLSNKS